MCCYCVHSRLSLMWPVRWRTNSFASIVRLVLLMSRVAAVHDLYHYLLLNIAIIVCARMCTLGLLNMYIIRTYSNMCARR